MNSEQIIQDLLTAYYKPNTQISKHIIIDILTDIVKRYKQKGKVLIFGTGYDTDLWVNANKDGQTLFVEHDPVWFQKAAEMYPGKVVFHPFDNITVDSSMELTTADLKTFPIPAELLETKWDIVIIDGPTGCNGDCPGRALPIYWTKEHFSHTNTIVYIDDCDRDVEKRFIDECFDANTQQRYYEGRYGTIRIAFFIQARRPQYRSSRQR